ncbi:putative mynd domain [Phaeomoniella chlamydospora]|uniref:Putative mynd domain n=1 Tax=Phaeomoniella chlamydospora TaxID=158046 RepID=A0A0G2EYV7_PHACM|nr:putative mynd domain [Phaeomoniella chlamydospora]
MDDDYKFDGDVEAGSLYDGSPSGEPSFRRYMNKVQRKKNLLPPWWSAESVRECLTHGRNNSWSNLNCAVEKSDIIEHYGHPLMPMQLRMFAEQVYGTGPGGQSGTAMLELQVSAEQGEGFASTMGVNFANMGL